MRLSKEDIVKVRDIMNDNPICCLPDTGLQEVAEMMVEYDCGAIPVVDDPSSARPLLGVITDRDIVCRSIAAGRNPLQMKAKDCMTVPAISVKADDSLEHCTQLMEDNMIRRIPVVDDDGAVCGIVTQAHIAKNTDRDTAGEFLQSVSKKTDIASKTAARR